MVIQPFTLNPMSSLTEVLATAGLEAISAEIYVILAENGELAVPQILEKTTMSRASVYEALTQLLAQNYVEYRKEGRNAYYKAAHPNKLFGLIDEKKRQERLFEEEMTQTIKSLTGAYNLANNKPGVRFFEGVQGIYTVLDYIAKSFKPDTQILSFVKVKAPEYEKQLNSAVDNFIKKRIELGVKTLVLAIDSPEAKNLKQNDKNALRETRLVPSKDLFLDFPGGEIFVYGHEVCMVTAEKNTFFALTLSSPAIAQMFKTFFSSQWMMLSS